MKTSLMLRDFKTLFFSLALTFVTVSGYSQYDTLHLYYKGLQTALLDSNEAKIGAWAKKLNGKHVVVDIVAYYEKSDFKKYSETRADEALLIVNRKARDLVRINSTGPKKGEKSQRSTVDIIYQYVGSPSPEPKKENEKPVAEKKENTNNTAPKDNDKPVVAKKDEPIKKSKPSAPADPNYNYDTIYVNGVMKVSKTKKPVLDPNYKYDTLYINGVRKITKTKIKK